MCLNFEVKVWYNWDEQRSPFGLPIRGERDVLEGEVRALQDRVKELQEETGGRGYSQDSGGRGYNSQDSGGQVKCGKGCTQIIKALKKLQRKEKKKKEQDYASVSNRNGIFRREEFTQWSFETVEVYSYEDKTDGEDISGGGGKGLKVEEGQKLSQKQLQMLETAAEEKLEASTNPLCKNQNLFRFLFEKVRKHEQKIDLQESIFNRDNPLWP